MAIAELCKVLQLGGIGDASLEAIHPFWEDAGLLSAAGSTLAQPTIVSIYWKLGELGLIQPSIRIRVPKTEFSMEHFMRLPGLFLFLAVGSGFSADKRVEDLYAAKCVWCHGNNGRGARVGRDLGTKLFQDPEMVKLSVSDFAKIIKDGKNNMPSFRKRLSDEEIKALAKYVKELR